MERLIQNDLRALSGDETARLEAQGNRSRDWSGVRVAASGFDAGLIRRCEFDGDAVIGGNVVMTGAYIASSGDGGHGYRPICVINENGGRAILPSPGMSCAAAFIWAKFRGDRELTAKFSEIALGGGEARRAKTIIGGDTFVGAGVHIRDSVIGGGNVIDSAAQLDGVMTGENVSISKAARIADSFVGDGSNIARCEIANCFIAPFHSQHHNNSFLIAAMIGGQSNVAAGATVGSNHNSRMYDGEIWAKRGFWPGLCVSLRHNSRFASFTMIAKGDYPRELDVKLPFSLVFRDEKTASAMIRPAFWFTRNMYAAMRRRQKLAGSEGGGQFIERDILAPDTVEEMFEAIRLLESGEPLNMERGAAATVVKRADEAVSAYRLMIRHYCAKSILPFMLENGADRVKDVVDGVNGIDINNNNAIGGTDEKWLNCGGAVIAEAALAEIVAAIKTDKINTWADVDKLFDSWASSYGVAKVRHALTSLARLEGTCANRLSDNMLASFIKNVPDDCETIIASTKSSRAKDYADPFRAMVYDSPSELEAVLGSLDADPVINKTAEEMNGLSSLAKNLLKNY